MKSAPRSSRHDAADTSERVAARAYTIWEQGGREDGHALAHWVRAEQEIAAEDASADRLDPEASGRTQATSTRSTR